MKHFILYLSVLFFSGNQLYANSENKGELTCEKLTIEFRQDSTITTGVTLENFIARILGQGFEPKKAIVADMKLEIVGYNVGMSMRGRLYPDRKVHGSVCPGVIHKLRSGDELYISQIRLKSASGKVITVKGCTFVKL